ncbi:MAG: DUF3179 domain-containing protein [Methyloligellaceae bacterium]
MHRKIQTNLFAPVLLVFFSFYIPVASATPDLWRSEGWKTDFSKTKIEFNEILSGGPSKDGIPAIDKPKFVSLTYVKNIGIHEPVISVSINGQARAYPLRILMWHEIVNDELGGEPITVTYCPLCNSAIVFKRRVGEKILDFGTTGKLRNSDLVMYDRQTESWWQQFTGEAIVGAYLGTELQSIPVRVEGFGLFRKRFPDGQVLVPNDPKARQYGNNPYIRYDSRNRPYPFFNGDLPEGIDPMARVVVFKSENKPVAIALPHLRARKSLNIGNITVSWQEGQNSALDSSEIGKGRDVGNVIVQEVVEGKAKDITYDVTFAFVVHSFHKGIKIIAK